MEDTILYFDNAASYKLNELSFEKYIAICKEYSINPNSNSKIGLKIQKSIQHYTKEILKYMQLDLNEYEVIFVNSATQANNMIIKTFENEPILTSVYEHNSNSYPIKKYANKIYLTKHSLNGQIDYTDLNNIIKSKKPTLISLIACESEVGFKLLTQNIQKNTNQYLHTDASQIFAKDNFDYAKFDYITISGHKFGTIKSIGALVKKKKAPLNQFLYTSENSQYMGTINFPAVYNFYETIQKRKDLDKIRLIYKQLKKYFLKQLDKSKMEYILNSKYEITYDHILNISFPKYKNQTIINYLSMNNILVSSMSSCKNLKQEEMTLSKIGQSKKKFESSVRISFSIENTYEQIDQFINRLRKMEKEVMNFGKNHSS